MYDYCHSLMREIKEALALPYSPSGSPSLGACDSHENQDIEKQSNFLFSDSGPTPLPQPQEQKPPLHLLSPCLPVPQPPQLVPPGPSSPEQPLALQPTHKQVIKKESPSDWTPHPTRFPSPDPPDSPVHEVEDIEKECDLFFRESGPTPPPQPQYRLPTQTPSPSPPSPVSPCLPPPPPPCLLSPDPRLWEAQLALQRHLMQLRLGQSVTTATSSPARGGSPLASPTGACCAPNGEVAWCPMCQRAYHESRRRT